MIIFSVIMIIVAMIYYLKILQYFYGLLRLHPGANPQQYSVTVLIPARNEEKAIARCLDSVLNQDYPKNLLQIHVIDDHSIDRTAAIVEDYQQRYPGQIQLHCLQEKVDFHQKHRNQAYKKAAIQYGIDQSDSEIIATIDADCWAQASWLTTLLRHFYDDVGMVCGYVLYDKNPEQNLFQRLQALEFLGLVTAGAGSLGSGQPVVGNGANLAYRRSVFTEVNGFTDIDQLPSGDDDLLMQKIHTQTKWHIRFAVEKTAINFTEPMPNLKQFLNQRTRWASKSTHYRNKMLTVFLSIVYCFYLFLVIGTIYSLASGLKYLLPLLLMLGKWVTEFLVVKKGCDFTERRDWLHYYPITQIFQILYILWVGFYGVFGKYDWKGRQISN